MKRKLLSAQFLFPAVILVAFAIVMVLSAFRPEYIELIPEKENPHLTYTAYTPGEFGQSLFFSGAGTVVRARIVERDGLYSIQYPGHEFTQFKTYTVRYTFEAVEVYTQPKRRPMLKAGDRRYMHMAPEYDNYIGTVGEKRDYLLFLSDHRAMPLDHHDAGFWQDYFNKLGYSTPPTYYDRIPIEEDGTVRCTALPPFLRVENKAFQSIEETVALFTELDARYA